MIAATAPPAAAGVPVGAGPPPAAEVRLALKRTHGHVPFVVAGERAYVRGVVLPVGTGPSEGVSRGVHSSGANAPASDVAKAPAQDVKAPAQDVKASANDDANAPTKDSDRVSVVFRVVTRAQGHKRIQLRHRVVTLTPSPGELGHFRMRVPTASAGHVTVTAKRASASASLALSTKPVTLRVRSADVHPGDGGPVVWLLQRELASLRYAVPLSGRFDAGTQNALIAYRKLTALPRLPAAGARVFEYLQRRKGVFHVRYPRDGRHVEAILSKQVLAEIDPHGKVVRIYQISSGKPSTPTVLGRYSVYLKTPGVNSEGMVDSNYFIRGYAIHGYAEVPTYAASHGCLRLPIEDAAPVYGWVRIGTIVDVYD